MIDEDLRRFGIGGSDVAAILSLSPYATPFDVYRSKIDDCTNQEDTLAMRAGRALEGVIMDEYDRVNDCTTKRSIEIVGEPSFMRGNLDGMRGSVVVEAKSISDRSTFGEAGTNQMPPYILCQVAYYRMLTDAPRVDVAVLFNRNDFEVFFFIW